MNPIANKKIIKDLELPLLTALSYYPELVNTKITFKYTKNAVFPFASRPNWKTMFKNKKDWEYLVLISESCNKMDPILLKRIPFEGQVGVIGHELAHTAYYLKKNILQIAFIGLLYFIPAFRKNFENNTDVATIEHGLGWHLYSFNTFVRSQKNFVENNKWFLKYYLSPEQILAFINSGSIKKTSISSREFISSQPDYRRKDRNPKNPTSIK